MITANSIHEIRTFVSEQKQAGKTIGFVPTMGALHAGHLDLIRVARAEADIVVASIFVNPTQFGPNEDFAAYPRTLDDDLRQCEQAGAAAVFCPEKEEVYGPEPFIGFNLSRLGDYLCGAARPGHFNGVIQIVNKLFNIVRPDVAVFGQKDIQQFRILETMTQEFNHDIRIIMGRTVRAADGLALSSRNRYLSPPERVIAPSLFGVLQETSQALQKLPAGRDTKTMQDDLLNKAAIKLNEAGFRTDYVQCVRYQDLQPVTQFEADETYVLAGAAYLGKARLIDNILFTLF
ncbi:pantothenate synthetase [Cyclonatronum proteinivorum]|uniref:Pantothenate synthetase n=1 Tax=Cyclonatronum proteinivorum TaxID=1457365 RepID=A0A345UHP2_9BACT|nr:pantoate--beta-alanine ligase [Cyclonatronum proteinivorum]AXI99993.1 pantothenate synthetase [Cyclonatronum proteinivorum]